MKKFNEWAWPMRIKRCGRLARLVTVRFSAHMTEPQIFATDRLSEIMTPGTKGVVNADVVYTPINSEADFEKYGAKLKGKVCWCNRRAPCGCWMAASSCEMTDDDIKEANDFPIPPARAGGRGGAGAGPRARAPDFARAMGLQTRFKRSCGRRRRSGL